MTATEIAWQASMFDVGEDHASIDATFEGLHRTDLDATTWVDLLPGWVHGGDLLLDELVTGAPWAPQQTRKMWDNLVAEPRIIARWPDLSTLPPVAAQMRALLSERYATDFDLVAVNLYRDGQDSVAWHGDRVRLTHTDPLVVTVSIGARRTFRMRKRGGGPSILTLQLGAGDLLVMGGRCQHDYEHTVPKMTKAVGARMSLTFRHSGIAGRR